MVHHSSASIALFLMEYFLALELEVLFRHTLSFGESSVLEPSSCINAHFLMFTCVLYIGLNALIELGNSTLFSKRNSSFLFQIWAVPMSSVER